MGSDFRDLSFCAAQVHPKPQSQRNKCLVALIRSRGCCAPGEKSGEDLCASGVWAGFN